MNGNRISYPRNIAPKGCYATHVHVKCGDFPGAGKLRPRRRTDSRQHTTQLGPSSSRSPHEVLNGGAYDDICDLFDLPADHPLRYYHPFMLRPAQGYSHKKLWTRREGWYDRMQNDIVFCHPTSAIERPMNPMEWLTVVAIIYEFFKKYLVDDCILHETDERGAGKHCS